MFPYPAHVEKGMRKYYGMLSEKDKRWYAAVEALKLGHGGKRYIYISTLLGCSHRTILRGLKGLNAPSNEDKHKKTGQKTRWRTEAI